jgi:SHAQKYF class myb-like DNA-binding protein
MYTFRTMLCPIAPIVGNSFTYTPSTLLEPTPQCELETTINIKLPVRSEEKKYHDPIAVPRNSKGHVIWTGSLHDRFVTALSVLGPAAVPSSILDFMNAPELTRENVGSHLQKFKKRKSRIKIMFIHSPITKKLFVNKNQTDQCVNKI